MGPENLLIIAIFVFLLLAVGLTLTFIEFKRGAPKQQMHDKDKLQESPHGHVD